MSIARVVLLSAALAGLPLAAQTVKVVITSPGTYYCRSERLKSPT
jgi:hypothetical protein